MTSKSNKAHPARVLVVDDEEDLLHAVKALLLKRANIPGLEVVTAKSAEEALGLLRATHFDLILADHRMQGMTGTELLADVKRRFPRTARVLITAYDEADIAIDAINRAQVHAFIKKPWGPENFIQMVRRVLAEAQRSAEFEDAVSKGLVGVRPPPGPEVRAGLTAGSPGSTESQAEAEA